LSLSLTAGDFNEDGHLDLLIDNRMLLGSGTGSFAAPITINLPGHLNAAIAGDVNGDGHLDLVGGGSSGLTILLGNGAGNFTQGKSYTSGTTIFGAGSSFAALGDFNEDGKVDLAAVQSPGLSILDGDGTGAFYDALSYRTSISGPRGLVTADFNNDGKQDFATLSRDNLGNIQGASSVEVALGDANGGFTKKSVSRYFPGALLSSLATADFNNDGKFDLAVTQPFDGKVSILLNDGTGGFPTDGSSAPSYSTNSFGFRPSAIKAGDFNNDGNSDLIAITPNSNNFVVLLGNGSGSFTLQAGAPLQGSSSFFEDLAIADFNADGNSDLAVIRGGVNVVNVLQGDGNGHFFSSATLQVPGTTVSVVARDLNGDGKPDIAVSNAASINGIQQGYISVFINNGAQGIGPGTNYPSDGIGILGVGDFNGDGQPDLAVSSGATYVGSSLDGIAILSNRGSGAFDTAVNFSAGTVSDHLAVSDFNNDGKDDVIVTQPSSSSVALLLNNFTTAQQCLSVNDVTVTETDAGTTDAIFTVKLSAASAQTVRVNYYSGSAFLFGTGQAQKGVDFESVPGTLTFLPGETTKTISVPVKSDAIDEFDEVFYVRISTPLGAAISDSKGVGTILDNDPPPTISINDAAVAEGNSQFNPSSATFTISLAAASEKSINVQYTLAGGTATPNTDYSNVSGTVDFPAGVTSKTISVPISGDNVFELDETFFVNLSNATNATIADGQGQGTITNDDPQPSITLGSSSFRTEGAAGTTNNATYEVRLSNPSYQTITVAYATADGTATAGSDYAATSGTITFNPGETTKSITVQLSGDNVDETNETYFVNLSSPTNATIAAGQGVGTIQDDDGPAMSISSTAVKEGNTGFTDAIFTVTLSAPSVQDIGANFGTTDGTAVSNTDFQRANPIIRTLTIPAGATSTTITIRVVGDYLIEPDETFVVNILNPFNGTIANGQATGTILNDDANGKLQFSSPTYTAFEGANIASVLVTRTDGGSGTVTVDYSTSNGAADAGSDYAATSGTLTFNQGEFAKSFNIPINNDGVNEGDETINLTLSNPTGGAILGSPTLALLTLKDASALYLNLDQSGPDPNQAVALDAVLLLRDPLQVFNAANLLNQSSDRNTRVIIFVNNLQLAPGENPASVIVNLIGSNNQIYDVAAEDVRIVPGFNFAQVIFRLPDNLSPGRCTIKVKAHGLESNPGTIPIKN
jgi:hypothetical protein